MENESMGYLNQLEYIREVKIKNKTKLEKNPVIIFVSTKMRLTTWIFLSYTYVVTACVVHIWIVIFTTSMVLSISTYINDGSSVFFNQWHGVIICIYIYIQAPYFHAIK